MSKNRLLSKPKQYFVKEKRHELAVEIGMIGGNFSLRRIMCVDRVLYTILFSVRSFSR